MTKRKVCVAVTARPSYSRIRSALLAIDRHPQLELQLVVAASALLERYGSVVDYIENDGFEIQERVFMVLEGENLQAMAKTTGLGLLELSTVFANLCPDIVVSVADRFETLATAIAAAYMNIPVAHVQGGEITGSIDEKVRHAVTKLADLHLTANAAASTRVRQMGELEDRIFTTGCPSIDVAAEVLEDPVLNFDPFQKYGGVGSTFDLKSGYVVVMQHPVTTSAESARHQVEETLRAIHGLKVNTMWFWPNVDAGSDGTSNAIRTFRETHSLDRFHFFKNMAPTDFLRVLKNSDCLIGNSSVGIRECAHLGIPVVNIGDRQSGRDRGPNVVDVAYDRSAIAEAVRRQRDAIFPSSPTYGQPGAGARIADVLASAPLSHSKRLQIP